MYIRIDMDNNEIVDTYKTDENLIEEANYFYHNTFGTDDLFGYDVNEVFESNYDENFEVKTVEEAKELFESNGYAIEEDYKESEEE